MRYSRVKTIKNPKDNNGAKFYSTTFYPKVPLSENSITLGNKFDPLFFINVYFIPFQILATLLVVPKSIPNIKSAIN